MIINMCNWNVTENLAHLIFCLPRLYFIPMRDCKFWVPFNNFTVFFLIQDVIRLSFFSQPDGPIMGNGTYKSSILVPGYVWGLSTMFQFCLVHILTKPFSGRKKEAFYLSPPGKDKLPKVNVNFKVNWFQILLQ